VFGDGDGDGDGDGEELPPPHPESANKTAIAAIFPWREFMLSLAGLLMDHSPSMHITCEIDSSSV
jgi:hypothetical protein